MQEHRTLAAALVAAQTIATAVEKESKNSFHNYKYASAEAIMAESREALNEAGLATIMERWELLAPTHDGAHERVKVYFVTLHACSEQTLKGDIEYPVIPEKGKPEDKATATALTYAEGYYLRGLLCLPRVEAGTDVDQRNDKEREPVPRRPANKSNGKPPQNGDPTAFQLFHAKLVSLKAEQLVEKLSQFDAEPGKALEVFGSKDDVDMARAAVLAELYKKLDIDLGFQTTPKKLEEFERWVNANALKHLSQMQQDTLLAKIERQREKAAETMRA